MQQSFDGGRVDGLMTGNPQIVFQQFVQFDLEGVMMSAQVLSLDFLDRRIVWLKGNSEHQ